MLMYRCLVYGVVAGWIIFGWILSNDIKDMGFTMIGALLLSIVYGNLVLEISLNDDDVVFIKACGIKIRVKNSDIIEVRKYRPTDPAIAAFEFNVKDKGRIRAGFFLCEPIVTKNGIRYEDVRQEDFPTAKFIHFD